MRYALAGGLVVLAIWAGIKGFGEIVAAGPRGLVAAEVKPNQLPVDKDWSSAYALLSQAASIESGDAAMRFELGRLAWWQAINPDTPAKARWDWLATSAADLQAALQLRPSWGRAWAELAHVERLRGNYLAAHHALTRAMHYEPYEADTEWMVMATGFAMWPMLRTDDQARFLDIARHVLSHYWVQWAIVPAVTNGREDVIRPMIAGNERAQEMLDRRVAERERARSRQR